MKLKYAFLSLILVAGLALNVSAQTLYKVDVNSVAGTPDGLSWDSAYADLQEALEIATAGDTIFVSEGTYFPDRGTGDRDSTFHMVDKVVIMGGFSFANDDTTLATRKINSYQTILSGEIQQDANSTNNSYIIVTNTSADNIDIEAVLDGFTITGAYNSNEVFGTSSGGGMSNNTASPLVRNCIFTNNTVTVSAGGTAGGGAVYNFSSTPTFVNCTFSNNISDGDASTGSNSRGGAIWNNQVSNPTFFNCVFTNNESFGGSTSWGGAIYNQSTSNTEFEKCIFQFNECHLTATGGGNFANGAAIFNHNGSSSDLTNCLISDNTVTVSGTALAYGGAICNFSGFSAYTIANTTITKNTATGGDDRGGAMWSLNDGGGIIITNSIIYDNSASTDPNFSKGGGTGPTWDHTDIQGSGGSSSWVSAFGTDNGGNIDEDPDFIDVTTQNYRLEPCSPAQNTGSLSGIPSGVTVDLDSNTRVQADSVDMGAYEVDGASVCGFTWDGSTDTDWGTASNWEGGIVPPDSAAIIIPDVANDPVLDAVRIVSSLNIEAGATLTLGSNRLRIYGDLDNSGTIINSASVIELFASTTQNIDGDLTIDTLIMNGTGSATIASGTTSIRVELRPENGTLNTGGLLTLLSDTLITARIAEIKAGATISGDVTVNQYVGGTLNEWRNLTSPIQGKFIFEWDDNIITTGFNNSDYPSFPFINIYSYDETVTGVKDNGYVGATNTTNVLGTAKGFLVYMGSSSTTIDLKGTIHSGTIVVPLSFTSTPSAGNDGWNLIGNPYPSDVDFTNLTLSSGSIVNGFSIYNPSVSNYAQWNEAGGVGTNGADGNIAQGHGFWVRTTAAATSITFNENDKISGAAKFFYKRSKPVMRMAIYKGSNRLDEAVLMTHPEATMSADHIDTRKIYGTDINAAAVAFVSEDMEQIAINSIHTELEYETIIPIVTHGKKDEIYTLSFSGTELLTNDYCVVLEDLKSNVVVNLNDSSDYTFKMPYDGESQFLRLRLTPAPKVELIVNGEERAVNDLNNDICVGDEVQLSANGLNNSVFNWNNDITNGQLFTPELGSKVYEVLEINPNAICDMSNDIKITVNELPEPGVEENGGILSTEEYSKYKWFKNGDPIAFSNKQEIETSGDGMYAVQVETAEGCSGTSEEIEVKATGLYGELGKNEILVYPNPGKDNVTIQFGSSSNAQLTVTNVVGKIVMEQIVSGQQKAVINTSNLQNGVYFISITEGDDVKVIKWVKQ